MGSVESWVNHILHLHQSDFLQHLVIFKGKKKKNFIKNLEVCVIKCQHVADVSQGVHR